MTRLPNRVIYRRARVSGRAWAVPFVLWLVGGIAIAVYVAPAQGLVTGVVSGILVPAIIAVVWLLTLWSMNRYGSLVLTGTMLRVGRDTVPVASLDPAWIEALAASRAPGVLERAGRSAATVQLPGQSELDPASGRLLGGAYGATLGDDQIVVRTNAGTRFTIATTDREGLIAGLLAATGG